MKIIEASIGVPGYTDLIFDMFRITNDELIIVGGALEEAENRIGTYIGSADVEPDEYFIQFRRGDDLESDGYVTITNSDTIVHIVRNEPGVLNADTIIQIRAGLATYEDIQNIQGLTIDQIIAAIQQATFELRPERTIFKPCLEQVKIGYLKPEQEPLKSGYLKPGRESVEPQHLKSKREIVRSRYLNPNK